jgi:DNA gyrase subunit A
VNDTDDLMIINRSGLTIRLSLGELRTIGRATQGVRLFKVAANDEISSVAKVAAAAEEELETLIAEAAESEVLEVDLADVTDMAGVDTMVEDDADDTSVDDE